MKTDTTYRKIHAISRQEFPALQLGVSAGICQRALLDESGMIRSHMWTHNISENGRSAWDALHHTTP
jgi:hypothetical protein